MFPTGAIVLAVYLLCKLVISFLRLHDSLSFADVLEIIIIPLSQITLLVMLLYKKNNIFLSLPLSILLLSGLYTYFVSSNIYVLSILEGDLLSLISIAPLLWIILKRHLKGFDIPIKGATILFYVTSVLNLLIRTFVVFSFFINETESILSYELLVVTSFYLYPLGILLIGRWISDPYNSPKHNRKNPNDYRFSIGLHIFLLIFTFGIWYLYWIHKTTDYTNSYETFEYRNPTSKLLLCILVPFYLIYWTYKTAKRIDIISKEKSVHSDLSTISCILSIFVPIIPPVLIQDKINKLCYETSDSYINPTLATRTHPFSVNTSADELKKFKELLDMGAISQEEYEIKKKELLNL